MISEADVRQELVAVLERRLSLANFQDWLVERSWNMHKDSSAAAQDLVSTVELALAEHSNGHLSASELEAQLRNALNQVVVNVQINNDLSISPRASLVVTGHSAGPWVQRPVPVAI
jgi:hypothetical protein